MKKTVHFLCGIPRSGSTVLGDILNQNPIVHTSTNSHLVNILDDLASSWHNQKLLVENDSEYKKLAKTLRSIVDSFYDDIDTPIIIDKAQEWSSPHIILAMEKVLNRQPKFIVTVRSIPDCAASFVRMLNPHDLDEFLETSEQINNLKAAYINFEASYKFFPHNFLFVEYEDLIANPKVQLERIHKFLNLPLFNYNFNNINWLSAKNPVEVLKHCYPVLCQPEFWLDTPRTYPPVNDLNLQFAASLSGDFVEGWRLVQKLEIEQPENHRAAFNRGSYYLRQGQIQKGYQLMNRGRIINVFGDKRPNVPTPHWDGKSKGIVLLNLEGGLGDQIHQIRYAKYIAQHGCKVIVACSDALANLFVGVEGVSSIVYHEAAFGVYHDFWVAGMSTIVPLGFELNDISGAPYISKPTIIKSKKRRIGLRWQGNSKFEEQHHKKFPSEMMFSAVCEADAEFISLQRDDGSESCPNWVKTVPLDNWENTRNAIASCDLVISSCTSVSHLAGAMGIPTWVVIPVMPYFLYVLDGEKTPYYDSFTLFRQEVYGDWNAPFDAIRKVVNIDTVQKIRRIK
jgi:hypothetical protein